MNWKSFYENFAAYLLFLLGMLIALSVFILLKRHTRKTIKSLLITLTISLGLTAVSIWVIGGWDGLTVSIITLGMICFTIIYLFVFLLKKIFIKLTNGK